MARHVARKYAYRDVNLEDLEQVAALGLVLAVDRFDVARGVDFLPFAIPTISGEVLRYFRDRAGAIRMPRRLRELQPQLLDTAGEFAQRHGRLARPAEIAAALGWDLGTVVEGLRSQQVVHTFSLDEPARDEGHSSGDHLRFGAALRQIEAEFDLVEHRESLAPLLARLDERQRRILVLRYFQEMTQTEIAVQVGISQMHVSHLLSRTLAWLRARLAD